MNASHQINSETSNVKQPSFLNGLFWVGGSASVSLLCQFVVAKLVAVYLPVSDFGIIGQYLSLIYIIQFIGGGIISSGVIKYFSEYATDRGVEFQNLFSSVITLVLILSILSTVMFIPLSHTMSVFLFRTGHYTQPLMLLGVAIFPYSLLRMVLSMYSGLSYIRGYASLNMMLSIGLLIIVCTYFIMNKSLISVLYAFPSAYIVLLPIFLYFLRKLKLQEKIINFRLKIDSKQAKNLICFSLMPAVSVLLAPISQIVIRRYISSSANWNLIGNWQAMNKISDAYMLIISMFLLNYFMPKISALKTMTSISTELKKFCMRLLPFASLVFVLSIACRKWIILILYSKKYLSISVPLLFQFGGDFFRVMALVFVYVLIARAKVKYFVLIESFVTLLLILFTIFGFHYFGLLGMAGGYFFVSTGFFLVSFSSVLFFLTSKSNYE